MKNLLLVAFTLLTICIYGCSQKEVEPPTAVVAAFQQMFPDAGNVRWELEKNGDYEANFKLENEKHSANFSAKGEWVETEGGAPYEQLPEIVRQAFETAHPGAEVIGAAIMETSAGVNRYEVETQEGDEKVEFFYNADGTEYKK